MTGKTVMGWLILVVLAGAGAGICSENAGVSISWEPSAYQKVEKDPLVISLDAGYAPLTFLNADGDPAGLFVDIWCLWSEKTGREIEFRAGNWDESVRSVKNGAADIHSGLFYSDDRATWMGFSQPFYEASSCFFYPPRHETDWRTDGFEGKKIGATKGSYQEDYLRKNFPNADTVSFASIEEVIRATLAGEIVAFLAEDLPVAAILTLSGLTGKLTRDAQVVFAREIHAGTPKDDKELLSLIDGGFDAISDRELSEIEKNWIPNPEERYFRPDRARIRFSAREKNWIEAHPKVKLGLFEGIPPVMFVGEDGTFRGIVKEVADIIGKRSGIRFEIVPIGTEIRKEFLRLVKEGEIDVFPGFDSPGRRDVLNFTRPFYRVSWVIISRNEMPFIRGPHDLKSLNQRIALQKWQEKPTGEYPDESIVRAKDPLDALELVSFGKADAAIVGLDVASYLIRKHGLSNLKVAAPAGYPDSETRLAVGKDMPELGSILDKAIASIDRRETDEIIAKWLPVLYEQGADVARMGQVFLTIFAGFALLLVVSFFWCWRLAREVNERKRAQEELKITSMLLQDIIDNSMALIVAKDTEGKYILASGLSEKMISYEKGEMIGKTDYEIFPKDLADKFVDEDRRILESGRPVCVEDDLFLLGQWHTFVTTKFPLFDENGRIRAFCGMATDITERKKIEARLQEYSTRLEEMVEARTRELERAQKELLAKERLAVLGHFAGSISHELRNPLAAIETSAYYLNMKLGDRDEKIGRHLGTIRNNVKKSTDIIQSLLSLSRMEKPKTERRNPVDVVSETLQSAKIPATVEVIRDFQERDAVVEVAPEQLRMALKNIVENAVEAMGESGGLTATVRRSCKAGFPKGEFGTVEIVVSDTGPGIPEKNVEEIFEPLFTTKTHGIGFGLSIAKMIVENHGGSIRAESTQGSGARIVIALKTVEGSG